MLEAPPSPEDTALAQSTVEKTEEERKFQSERTLKSSVEREKEGRIVRGSPDSGFANRKERPEEESGGEEQDGGIEGVLGHEKSWKKVSRK